MRKNLDVLFLIIVLIAALPAKASECSLEFTTPTYMLGHSCDQISVWGQRSDVRADRVDLECIPAGFPPTWDPPPDTFYWFVCEVKCECEVVAGTTVDCYDYQVGEPDGVFYCMDGVGATTGWEHSGVIRCMNKSVNPEHGSAICESDLEQSDDYPGDEEFCAEKCADVTPTAAELTYPVNCCDSP